MPIAIAILSFGVLLLAEKQLCYGEDLTRHQSPSAQSPAAGQEFHLFIGQTTSLPYAKHVWIEQAAILQAKIQGKILRLKGRKPGLSLVRWNNIPLEFFVHSSNLERNYYSLKKILSKIGDQENQEETFEVKLERQSLKVHANRHQKEKWSFSQWKEIADRCWLEKCSYTFSESLRPEQLQELVSHFRNLFPFHPELQFQLDSFGAILPVLVPKHEVLIKHLQAWGIPHQLQEPKLVLEPLIQVDLQVSEIKRSALKSWGVDWPHGLPGQLKPVVKLRDEDLAIAVKALEETGEAKTLAKPNLICRSGKEAEFLAGGEIPFRITTIRTKEVVWKKFGILLRIKPVADIETGAMSIALETEVSSPNFAVNVDGMPTLHTQRLSTHIDLQSPKQLVLSGLIHSEFGQGSSGIPWLKSIPILGALFASENFHKSETELVILMRPHIVRNTEPEIEGKVP